MSGKLKLNCIQSIWGAGQEWYFHMPAFMQKLVIVELTLAHVQLAKQLRAPDQEGSKDPGVKSQLAYDFSTMNASDSVEHWST